MISAIPPCVLQMLALFTVLFKGKNNGLLARTAPESRADFNQNSETVSVTTSSNNT